MCVPPSNVIEFICSCRVVWFLWLRGLPSPRSDPVASHLEVYSWSPVYWLKRCSFFSCIFRNQPLTNKHLLGGCKHNAKLRTSKHNITLKLLQEQLEKHKGGRWPIVIMYLGNQTIKDFKAQIKIEMATPQEDTTLQALEASQEGLQDAKANTQHPTIIPTDLIPKHKRPQHYKPDIIRAIGVTRKTQG